MGAAPPCNPTHRSPQFGLPTGPRSSPHATPATGAFCEAPYGATISLGVVPKWVPNPRTIPATGAFCGAPYGATILVMGVAKWVRRASATEAFLWSSLTGLRSS
eukprot:233117-Pyramimonas_sp.AAC.1